MRWILILLWYAVWGMYRGVVEKKTQSELFVLLVVVALVVFLGDFTITSKLPGIGLILLLFLWIAIRRARERKEGDE